MKNTAQLICLLAALLLPAITQAKSGEGKKQFDANGDGMITKAEAETAGARRLLQHFEKIDANGDGNLTRDELKSFRGKTREKIKQRRANIRKADTDGNRALSYDEAAAAGMDKLVKHFDKVDTDGDGEITRNEMSAARQQLRERRQDGSERGLGKQAI